MPTTAKWATYSLPNNTSTILDLLSLGGGRLVAVGAAGVAWTSDNDGALWTVRTAAEANDWTALAFDGTTVVAVGKSGTHRVMTSTDFGHTWTARTAAEANQWASVCWSTSASTWIAVSVAGAHQVMTSPDAITWTARTAAAVASWVGVAARTGIVVAVSDDTPIAVMTSPDGITWTSQSALPAGWQLTSASAAYGSNVLVFGGLQGAFFLVAFNSGTSLIALFRSANGAAWMMTTAIPYFGASYGASLAVAQSQHLLVFPATSADPNGLGTPSQILFSTNDGVTWTTVDTGFHGSSGNALWVPAAWDEAASTVIFVDAIDQDAVLVGIFTTTYTISPPKGPITGGTLVTLSGQGFNGVTAVTFGGVAGTSLVILNDATLTVVTPPHATGPVAVATTGAPSFAATFTYVLGTRLPPIPHTSPLTRPG